MDLRALSRDELETLCRHLEAKQNAIAGLNLRLVCDLMDCGLPHAAVSLLNRWYFEVQNLHAASEGVVAGLGAAPFVSRH